MSPAKNQDKIKKLTGSLRRVATRVFREARKQKDPGQMAMLAGDARDMFEVARLMEERDFFRAGEVANRMDTAAREEIPSEVIDFLYEPPF